MDELPGSLHKLIQGRNWVQPLLTPPYRSLFATPIIKFLLAISAFWVPFVAIQWLVENDTILAPHLPRKGDLGRLGLMLHLGQHHALM
jgi:hypothetical protein